MKALEGIRVLDFSTHTAGPTACAMMADLGAEVIKVERPVEGDDTRTLPNSVQGYSTQFMYNNRGKKSITVDLKDPEAAGILLELGKTCDIVLESGKPGSMAKMGLDYEAFKAVKPDIIYCSISAFGQTGPKAKDPGFDILAQASSGIMDMTGERNGPPMKSGVIMSDFISGKDAFGACMVALFHKFRTGEGQMIDVAMQQCLTSMNPFLEQATNGKDPHRQGNHSAGSAPYGVFMGPKNEYLVIAAHPDRLFSKLCTQVLGQPELVDDPRFVGGSNRAKHYRELADIIEAWMAQFDSVDEAKAIMDKAGIVCGKILSCKGVIEDEQILYRKGIMDLPLPADREGTWRGRGIIIEYSATPQEMKAAPVLGSSNYEILAQAGLSPEKIYELETKWGQPIEKP
jgi:crotonobetainyl-CoA:carnitine CoA-transferase CaiB-like acyl-CoA transferase